jgi:hypothetical protein
MRGKSSRCAVGTKQTLRHDLAGHAADYNWMGGYNVQWAPSRGPDFTRVAVSTMATEYQVCGAAARELLSLHKALWELAVLSGDFLLRGPIKGANSDSV